MCYFREVLVKFFKCYVLFRKSICQSGLYALRWTTVLVEGALKATEEDGVDYTSLVLSQANLLAVVTAYGEKRSNDKAYSMVSKLSSCTILVAYCIKNHHFIFNLS